MSKRAISQHGDGLTRRNLLVMAGAAATLASYGPIARSASGGRSIVIDDVKDGEDVFAYIGRMKGGFDQAAYQQVIGAANAFKEGDQAIGVGAQDEASRRNARALLANTKIKDLHQQPLLEDDLQKLIWQTTDQAQFERVKDWTIGRLKEFLLTETEEEIKGLMTGLTSDTIGMVPKLMNNEELISLSQKLFNVMPGTKMGAKGYMGARIQPNSPTDHPDDIVWQVFDAFSYATGDIVIGTNPVDSTVESVVAVERALKDIVDTFGLADVIPWCVLAHIDVQAETAESFPGTVSTMFQSLAGTDDCNKIFDITNEKILRYARAKKGERYGLYFETGQGSEFTNGVANGVDMMVLESRKYGFSRAVGIELANVQPKGAWLHVNDVAGFIGPEVFKSREQLVRCCLEDMVMGKLHGLTIGLDICTTLHMTVSLDDLDWCQDQIMPANPAYLIALPTKNDPMLSYLTTSFQDHVRLRDKFGFKVNDAMWDFYKRIGIVAADGSYTANFGDPLWVYYQYRQAKGDKRSRDAIYAEGRQSMREVEERGVDLATGHGANIWDLNPPLAAKVKGLYDDAKQSLWAELTPEFVAAIPDVVPVRTLSKDRNDYIAHPNTGEMLSPDGIRAIERIRDSWGNDLPKGQIVISDGLNAKAIMDDGHLAPYLQEMRGLLAGAGVTLSDKNIMVTGGRVRAGYRIGELLFENSDPNSLRGILHIIGERPGTMHHAYSVYITVARGRRWSEKGIDHDITKLVSNVADTALSPREAARETLTIIREIVGKEVNGSRRYG
ncbi:ethanolamine ammonia-lyase subunit EutB [Sinorhizobium alkalisoli]|uniref:ethanolamine ammonia-lyase subunit EutB n=1 Tax=Sinorhizobium alkalisoli TaxID=1752398 RepID=UPI00124F4606|nr:ethanolamine ammonia-lyase subunit EutB [Sinorhizobium alkalisoli]MCA1491791.1 ethanolamine ammonia-lyase subunit EutB [Ensifer sp. NBAIM29]QFI66905.1 Ethanolamine ammonia-lyase heavy chain [Sinorhizobium alkalisoli]